MSGLEVVGPLRSESGVGEASRAVVAGLDAAGVPVLPMHPPDVPPSRQGAAFATAPLDGVRMPASLLCLTALETVAFAGQVGAGWFAGHRTAGLWWWEVEEFPEVLHPGFAHVDEVWAGSAHVRDAIARVSPVPVRHVRVPVRRAAPPPRSRAALGLPEDGRPVFLTTFGYFSSVVRKNPGAVIDAFARAFAPGEAHLVVKCIDEGHHPAEHAALLAHAASHPDVEVRGGYLDRDELDALIAAATAVVSLHRAEGFGFTPAEAMAQGVPVVGTRYGGVLDFMTDDNALLVDCRMVRIGEHGGPYPHDARWAEPEVEHAAVLLRRLADEPELAHRLGARAARDLADGWSAAAAGATLAAALQAGGPLPRPSWRARLAAARLHRARRRAPAQ
jgi:glycosyltransferase involved in cell wall biosynthesis